MLRSASCLFLLTFATTGSVVAGPMPVLPDLPPLPTHYESQSDSQIDGGIYAGILSGFANGNEDGVGIAAVVGNTFVAADLLLGTEVLASAWSNGDVVLEGNLRAGAALTDTIALFGTAGLGYSFDTDALVSVGASLEAEISSGWVVRADYRYNHDLSADAGSHKVLAGLLRRF